MKDLTKFLAGLISPDVLQESPAIKKCRILEIRYDLFENIESWGELAQKVFELAPEALRLGTIRLEKDGGKWKNEAADERFDLFEKVLGCEKSLDWVDLERGTDFCRLRKLPAGNCPKIICSWHLFNRVPSETELSEFAEECINLKAEGCKVAAMAHSKNEVQPLYEFAKKYGKKFELFSAFAMGEHGKESRVRSLKEGANLTYGSIGKALAPGQLNIEELFSIL